MTGNPLVLEVDFDQMILGMQLQLFPHQLMRHRVEMLVILDVVINIHFDCFNVSVRIPLKSATQSTANRPPGPEQSGHPREGGETQGK